LFNLNWYVGLFSVFGWLSVIAITALFFAHIFIYFIKVTDLIPGVFRYVSLMSLPVSYVILRILFFLVPIPFIPTVSLLLSIGITSGLIVLFLHTLTNTFKFSEHMKSHKKSK